MNGYRITRVVTPADSLALVTLDQVKEILGITDTSQDAVLTQHIGAVSESINNWCDRIFAVQSYRDQIRSHVCHYWQPLVTRQYPITLGEGDVPNVAVTENGAALDPALFEVYPETGQLFRLDGSANPLAWASNLIVVDYTSGYPVIPDPVQNAALEWITVRWYQTGNDPTTRSETIPDVISQTFSGDLAIGAIPSGARDMLAPYRIWTV